MKWLLAGSREPAIELQGEHSYLASTADLLVGLLFVFIIMVAFLALQSQLPPEPTGQQQGLAGPEFPGGSGGFGPNTDVDVKDPRGEVTKAIAKSMKSTFPAIQADLASGVISLPEDVLFDVGKSVLKAGAHSKLGDVAGILSGVLSCYVVSEKSKFACAHNPEQHAIETIFVEGHTDNRPMAAPGGNMKLALDRAVSVGQALVEQTALGSYRNGQSQSIFSYSAYADTRPLKGTDPSDGRNRRVDLRLVLEYRPPQQTLTGLAPAQDK